MSETFKNTANLTNNLSKLIGDTPFIAIRYRYQGGADMEVLVKCEQYNFTGSIKDRLALYILQRAREQDKLKPGDLIVEASSGNSGISFAAIGRALGNRVKILMPDSTGMAQRELVKAYGGDIQVVSKGEGGFPGAIRMAEAMSHYDNVFLPRQFGNQYNAEVHEKTTGREIGHSLLLERIKPAAFVAGVGTGGTIMGIGKYLRSIFQETQVHPLEPFESTGQHRIQGINDEYKPAIVDLNMLNKPVQVNDGDAILMAQQLSSVLGLKVGISSGANFLAAVKLRQQGGMDKPVVTIFPDDNKRYTNTDLFRTEPVLPGYLSPDITLLDYRELSKV